MKREFPNQATSFSEKSLKCSVSIITQFLTTEIILKEGDMTLNVLTLSERAIIARYRSMSKEDQKKICEYIDMLYNEKAKKIL